MFRKTSTKERINPHHTGRTARSYTMRPDFYGTRSRSRDFQPSFRRNRGLPPKET